MMAVAQLQNEAERLADGVPVIWHQEIDAVMLREATSVAVFEISAATVNQALEAFDEQRKRKICPAA
jgi:hypothetical protein